MDAEAVRERARELPREPGVYQFNTGEVVLYVGKALDIRDRVASYADPRSERVRQMVESADELEYAVTDTETQALLLEANLIKRNQPRYNVRLKDDKSYPLVQFTDHPAPRIEITRDPDDSATVFGPYTSKGDVETIVKALRERYGLRGCSDHKYSGRERPCLDYEMGLCTAPCTGEIDIEAYREDVESAIRFFEGETGVLADPIQREMDVAAQEAAFERAAHLRDRLAAVESFHGAGEEAVQAQVDTQRVDVIGIAIEGDSATVARLHSERGQLVDRSRHRMDAPGSLAGDGAPSISATHQRAAGESDTGDDATETQATPEASKSADVISAFLAQYYAERDLPDAVLLSEQPSDPNVREWLEAAGVAVRVPGTGREAKLVELALKNARQGPDRGDELGALADALDIPRPQRIEGFDVSHAGGRAAVGSNVCFVDGRADKSQYRRKRLSDRNDDFANMRQLLTWRAKRALEGRDDRPDPDLLLVDGGDGQLGAAQDALAATGWDVPVVALAKEAELVITPDGTHDWPGDAPHLHVLQRVRDEAHRFAVQYHQTVRDDVSTALDGIPGIGPELRKRLLRRFGSVENVRDASTADLQDVPGVGKATAASIAERL